MGSTVSEARILFVPIPTLTVKPNSFLIRFLIMYAAQLNNDTLKLTVDYYDDQYKIVFYTKCYTIRFTANGYQYLSIIKK